MGWSRDRNATESDQKPVGMGARVEWDHRLWGRRTLTDDPSAPCTTYMSGNKSAQTLVFGEQDLKGKKIHEA